MTARAAQGKLRRRGVALALPVGVAYGLAACGGPSLDATRAADTYRPVVEDVTSTTGEALGVTWTPGSAETTQRGDTGCTWYSASFETSADLAGRLPEVRAALDRALAGNGFEGAREEQLQGGWVGVAASDGADATVSVQAKGRSTVRVAVPVTGDC